MESQPENLNYVGCQVKGHSSVKLFFFFFGRRKKVQLSCLTKTF